MFKNKVDFFDRPRIYNAVRICKQITILILHQVISRFVTTLKVIYASIQVSDFIVSISD
jgi:hypothetical protein